MAVAYSMNFEAANATLFNPLTICLVSFLARLSSSLLFCGGGSILRLCRCFFFFIRRPWPRFLCCLSGDVGSRPAASASLRRFRRIRFRNHRLNDRKLFLASFRLSNALALLKQAFFVCKSNKT